MHAYNNQTEAAHANGRQNYLNKEMQTKSCRYVESRKTVYELNTVDPNLLIVKNSGLMTIEH